MGGTPRDPIDHSRTTRQHAGESMNNGVNAPGIVGVGLGVVALFIGLATLASGATMAAATCFGLAALLFVAGGSWLFLVHRRVRRQELQRIEDDPHVSAQPPTS